MSNKRSAGVAFFATTIGLCLALPAAAAWTARGERNVTFHATGPGGLAIEGTGTDVTVREQDKTVQVSVGLGALKTGIDLRDRHMKEKYLETPKYPRAELTVARSKLALPGEGDADGSLTLHGVTRPVRVHYIAKGTEKELLVNGTLKLNMKEFGIQVPSYLGVTVKPDVSVNVRFRAVDG
ncbi:MAG TPA: YceI family protein [Polyangiaceae bacterium]|nr:YceI family protein [Polyangiaceae bacterium]